MKHDRLMPCRTLLVWLLMFTLALPASLSGCVARQSDDSAVSHAEAEARRTLSALQAAPAPAVSREETESGRTGAERTERTRSLNEVLFNTAASFAGLPGLAPTYGTDGLPDEGMGFHQDGTTRRAGNENSHDGKRARAYMSAGLNGVGAVSPLYADMTGTWPGDEYSGRRKASESRTFDSFNPVDMALERGLNYGMGLLNSAGEAMLSGLADNGRARLNFQFDRDGRFSGEGDVLLPFWDSPRHTLFTQFGARSMEVSGGEKDGSQRWIGNFGLGHRWFPFAEDMDNAGNLMLGWNAFFDNDFTRSHQRGGAGVEAQYDWFHLAANYYTPLSGWKDSYDFDGDFVEERPARGWDARLKAFLPFYRNLALTGSYSQWYGDNVAMYGSSDELEKDPRVWSYGMEYTPIPMLSAFVNQRSTERGRTDTEFGLQFTYRFGMSWEDQTSHDKVAELRTVSGSRHEFVDRENRIILEYRAKNAGRIEYLGPVPNSINVFAFRVSDGFGRAWTGQTAHVRADGVELANAACVTDGDGRFTVLVNSAFSGPVTLYVRAGENEQSFTVNVAANTALDMEASTKELKQGETKQVMFTFTRDGVPQAGLEVTFEGNPAIRELARDVTETTGSDGTVVLGLTALTNAAEQIVTVKAEGQSKAISFAVTPGEYVLTADPEELTQHKETEVVFTLTQGGIPVPKGTEITLSGTGFTFDGEARHTYATQDESGQITAKLTASQKDVSTIEASVNGGGAGKVGVTVTAAAYSLEASPDKLTQHKAEKVVFTLKANGTALSGVKVTFTSTSDFTGLPSGEQTTDGSGQIMVDNLTALKSGDNQTIEATVDGQKVKATISVTAATYNVVLTPSGGGGEFTGTGYQTITLTAKLTANGQTDVPFNDGDVAWEVKSSSVTSKAWNRSTGAYNGLTWGENALSLSGFESDNTSGPSGTAPTGETASLTDIVGERKVQVKATISHDEQKYTATTEVTFGEGPLAAFAGTPKGGMMWNAAVNTCGGQNKLPTTAQLRAVAGGSGKGAALAAGWPDDYYNAGDFRYWTGEFNGSDAAWVVYLYSGNGNNRDVSYDYPVAVCVP